ncbi:divergent polysaccharide deacetylase family protein [Roseibacterium sp. SDUM158016]|uniref:divergent polysaccharide deacetylase family protein n=1 Tax=Roseicyclus sediminis TaxID=2980997 RepID=UPI0021D1CB3A|nr:divergent polysaccharide deacetylase family protein [Roseibacterium sp. SDUM158016]MCU4653527.1 divergent polysaccharide deacetylase family protein [Roseibacterium sp. SDUM158016]
MGGGVILGMVWGLVVSVVVLAAVSLSTPLPPRPGAPAASGGAITATPEASMPEPPAEEAAEEAAAEAAHAPADPAPAAETAPDATPEADTPPPPAAPEPDATGETGSPTAPATAPATGAPADTIPLPAGSEFNRPPPEEDAVLPGTDAAPGGRSPDAPPLPDQTSAGGIDTASAPLPDVVSAAAAPPVPEATQAGPGAVAMAAAGGDAAQAPPVVRPARLPVPVPDAAAEADAEAPAAAPADPLPAPEAVAETAPDPVPTAPEPAAGAAPPETGTAAAPEPPAPATAIADATPPPVAADMPNVVRLVPPSESAPLGLAPVDDLTTPAVAPEQAPAATPTRPRVIRPGAGTAVGQGDGAGPGRTLPQVVTPGRSTMLPDLEDPSAETGNAADEAEADPAGPPADGDLPALVAYAAVFDETETRPLIGIVLIDEPDARLDISTLTGFPFPVAFAVDPMRPDAAERAATFRAAGFEVLMLGSAIPVGATASDTEVALAAARARVPEAVALMDTPDSRIQSDRAVLEAAVGAISELGQGLVAFPRGLNTAEQMAARADVPAVTVFRLLDDEGQRATLITRFLGRAEFAAVQEGGVIVAGRTRPDTVTALFSWALGNRNEGVAIAPVSAVLRRLAEDG